MTNYLPKNSLNSSTIVEHEKEFERMLRNGHLPTEARGYADYTIKSVKNMPEGRFMKQYLNFVAHRVLGEIAAEGNHERVRDITDAFSGEPFYWNCWLVNRIWYQIAERGRFISKKQEINTC